MSMAVRLAELQTLLADLQMPELLAGQDDYTCAACGDLVQKTFQVEPVGEALLLHVKPLIAEVESLATSSLSRTR